MTEIKNKIISWVEDAIFQDGKYDKIDVVFPDCDTTGGYSAEIVYVTVEAQKGKDKKKL